MDYGSDEALKKAGNSIMYFRYLDMALSEYSRITHLLDEMNNDGANPAKLFHIYLQRIHLILEELADDLDKVAQRSYKVK